MRIEVLAGTGGSIGTLQKSLDSLNNDILETIQALQSINHQLDNLNGGALTSAVESVNARICAENVKKDSLDAVSRQLDIFVETVIEKDHMVAHSIWQGQKKFFDEYEWLRPVVEEERTWWEQLCGSWNDFWSDAGEMLGNAWNDICEFIGDTISEMVAGMAVIATAIWEKSSEILKEAWDAVVSFINEHWVELLVGTIGIIVGTVLIVLSGGTLLAALAVVGKIVVSSMAVSAAINMAFAALTGGDLLQAVADGLASGYMWGGIMAAIAGIGTAISTWKATRIKKGGGYSPNNVSNQILKTDAASKWGVSSKGTNQGIEHYIEKAIDEPARITGLEKRLGVKAGTFIDSSGQVSIEGFKEFTKQAEHVIAEAMSKGQIINEGSKITYWIEGIESAEKGIEVIVYDGKIQSMMPRAAKDFWKIFSLFK